MRRTERILGSVSRGFGGDGGGGKLLEEKDAPEDVFDDAREVLGWVLSFSCCDGDGLGSTIWFLSVLL